MIRERTRGRCARIGIHGRGQALEPAAGYDAVAVDDYDVARIGGAEGGIHIPDKTEIQRLPEKIELVPDGTYCVPILLTNSTIRGSAHRRRRPSAPRSAYGAPRSEDTARRDPPGRRPECTPSADPAPRGPARPERAGGCGRSAPLRPPRCRIRRTSRPQNSGRHVETCRRRRRTVFIYGRSADAFHETSRTTVTRLRPNELFRSPWTVGGLLGVLHYCGATVAATTSQFQRYDDGIWLSAVALLDHGQLPLGDFYIPYGWGYALPGLPSRWLFADGAFVQHATYAIAVGLTTCLACVFVARRRGLVLGVCVAVLTLLTGVYRYALVWCAVLGFLLVVDAAVRSSSTRSLKAAANEREGAIVVAGGLAGNGGLVPRRVRSVLRCLGNRASHRLGRPKLGPSDRHRTQCARNPVRAHGR